MSATALPIKAHGIHHFAYKCRDAEETRRFYEDVLQMPLALVLVSEAKGRKSTTGDPLHDHAHFFFEMSDGNYVAFFDFGDGTASARDPATPAFANHLAIKVSGEAEILEKKARLEAAGVEVVGPMVHEFVRSIYFWDPNGVRLEFAYTISTPEELQVYRDKAHADLERWRAFIRNKKSAKQAANIAAE